MAEQGLHGGGHGGGAAVGDREEDRHRLRDHLAQLADIRLGGQNRSNPRIVSILNNDAQVRAYLRASGKVDLKELEEHGVPQNYRNEDAAILQKIIALLNLYQGMGIKRRKYLFLRLAALHGIAGIDPKEALVQADAVLKDYLNDKENVWESYREVKKVRAEFLREPEIFKNLPMLKSKRS